jgi:hypothetical protein
MENLKVSADGVVRKNYRVENAKHDNAFDDWYMPFEVSFREKHVESVRFLDQGSNGVLHSCSVEAFLRLIEQLKAEGYTI